MTEASAKQPNSERAANDLAISPGLLAMLVCPIDKSPLEARDRSLVCTKCQRAYPVDDGIPNMVVD